MVLANTQLFPHDCRQAIFFKFPSSRWSDRDLGKVTCLQDLRVVCKVFNEAVDRVEQELQIVRTICCKSSSDAARLRIVRSVHTLIIGDGNITPHIEALLYSPSKDCLKVIQLPCKPLTKEAVSILSRLPSLTKLVLSAHDTIPLEEELATSISSITNLEKIDIDSTCGETTCTPLIQSLCQLKKIKKIKLPYVCLTLDMVKILQANLPLLTTLDTLVLDQPLEELPRIVCRYPWNEGKKFICDPTNDYPFVESALRTIKEITDEKAKYHFLFCAKFSSSENIVSYCVEHYFDFDNAALQMLTEMLTPDCAKHSAVVWLFTSSIYHERFDITRRLITLGVDLNCRFNAVFDETGGEDYLTVLHYCIKKIALSESSEMEQVYSDLCVLLLDNGADPNIPDCDGIFPLTTALESEDTQHLVPVLLSAKVAANPNFVISLTAFSASVSQFRSVNIYPFTHFNPPFYLPGTYSTYSPLQLAIGAWLKDPQSDECKEQVKLLLSHKADVQITDDRGRNLFVILMLAVNSFPFEHVRSTLIASGINIQKNSETHVKKLMKLLYTLAESEIEPQDIIQEKLKYMAFLLEQGFTLDALSEAEKGCLLKLSETYKIANLDQLSKLQVHA